MKMKIRPGKLPVNQFIEVERRNISPSVEEKERVKDLSSEDVFIEKSC